MAALNPIWEFYDPTGTCSSSTDGIGNAQIVIPGGTSLDLYNGNLNAPRILQSVSDTDIEVQIKLTSSLAGRNKDAGLVFQTNNTNLLRFDCYCAATGGTPLRSYIGKIIAGNVTQQNNAILTNTPTYPLWMAVNRTGNVWTFLTSTDGENWTTVDSFAYAMTLAKVGFYAGTSADNPAHTAKIDYFYVDAPRSGISATAVIKEAGLDAVSLSGNLQITGSVVVKEANSNDNNGLDYAVIIGKKLAIVNNWTQYDPLGGCSFGTSVGNLSIAVPSGVKRDLWTDDKNAPRLLQLCGNTDFTIDVKLVSTMSVNGLAQGIIIEQDHNNFIRFSINRASTNNRAFVASIEGSASTLFVSTTISGANQPYIRVERAGDQWKFLTSVDGINYTTWVTFAKAITVSNAGLTALVPASTGFTALFDYFHVDYPLGNPNELIGNFIESMKDSISSFPTIAVDVGISGEFTENFTDVANGAVSVAIAITGDFSETFFDNISGYVGEYILPVIPLDPKPIINLFVNNSARVRSGLDRNTQACKSFYREVHKFAEITKPWEPAIIYETKPDEELDLTLVSHRVYGRDDEYLTIMAAAGLYSVEQRLKQTRLVLPTESQLNIIKRSVGFESQSELREDFAPVWADE